MEAIQEVNPSVAKLRAEVKEAFRHAQAMEDQAESAKALAAAKAGRYILMRDGM